MLFDYPATTRVERVIPKTAIYQHAELKPAVKRALVDEVEKITWRHKLSPDTLNIAASPQPTEIQVFELHPKQCEAFNTADTPISEAVLRSIDKAMPTAVIFEIRCTRGWQVMAAYKESLENCITSLGSYFYTAWLSPDSTRQPLPITLNMQTLYHSLLAPLLPHPVRVGESMKQASNRMTEIHSLEKKLEQLHARLRQEPQFNRKIAINAEIRDQQQQLNRLLEI